MPPDPIVPAVPLEGNAATMDPDRAAHLDPNQPHEEIEAWRAAYLTDVEPESKRRGA